MSEFFVCTFGKEIDPDEIDKIYSGMMTQGQARVLFFYQSQGDAGAEKLEPRREVLDHGAEFSWGNHGRGAQQLALAILMDLLEDEGQAVRLHLRLVSELLSNLDTEEGKPWMIPAPALRSWVEEQQMPDDCEIN